MRILTRVTWQCHFQTFHQIPRMIIVIFILRFVFELSAHLEIVSRWGILRSAIPCSVTIVKTVALLSCLARLHNFCIDRVERSKQCDKDILPLDLEHLMNEEVGCVQMVNITDFSYDVPIPRDIIDGGNHLDNCPWAARQSRQAEVVGINELP
jgi:hypothetical protein